MKYYLIGDEDSVLGFSLVGVEGKVVEGPQDTEDAIRTVIQRKDIGIILITEKYAKAVRPLIREITEKNTFPLIMELADRNGPDPDRPSIDDIIKNSIGINI